MTLRTHPHAYGDTLAPSRLMCAAYLLCGGLALITLTLGVLLLMRDYLPEGVVVVGIGASVATWAFTLATRQLPRNHHHEDGHAAA